MTQIWQQVELIAYLINLGTLVTFFFFVFKSLSFENLVVSISKLENGSVIWHQFFLFVDMTLRPFIKNDFLNEDVAFKNLLDVNSLLNQFCEIVLEQITCDVIVLVLHDVVYHAIYT